MTCLYGEEGWLRCTVINSVFLFSIVTYAFLNRVYCIFSCASEGCVDYIYDVEDIWCTAAGIWRVEVEAPPVRVVVEAVSLF